MTRDRAVRFDRLGDPGVFHLVETDAPLPGPGEVRVRVRYAGLNPVDAKIAAGVSTRNTPDLPSGNGNDFSGEVDALGDGVVEWSLGDRVFGGLRFHAQADHLVIAQERLSRVPEGLGLREAAVLDIAGRTAWASVDAVGLGRGDTVLIGGAAGGVGVFATQLAVLRGARVLGTCGASTDEFVRSLGAEPIRYGEGLVERVRVAAPEGVDAALDYEGRATVTAALALGVDPQRINTNADHAAVERDGVLNAGAHTMPGLDELRALAALVAEGRVRVPIAGEYPLEEVVAAYRELGGGHVHGKLVLRLDGVGDSADGPR